MDQRINGFDPTLAAERLLTASPAIFSWRQVTVGRCTCAMAYWMRPGRSATGRQEAEVAGPDPLAAAVGDVAHHAGLGELLHQ